jgi:hypothetical protein
MIKWSIKPISIGLLVSVLIIGSGLSCTSNLQQKSGNINQIVDTTPKELPIAFQPTKQNKGKRCAPRNYYLEVDPQEKEETYSECYRLQKRLVEAAQKGDLQEIREALKYGANIEGTFGSSFPALHTSAMLGQTQAVLLLLDNGADINMVSNFENYPIAMAASEGHMEVVKVLLQRGANVCFKTSAGTPEDTARVRGHKEIEELLKVAIANCRK